MTQRSTAPQRLPRLTEVVEYVGDVMTVRPLADASGPYPASPAPVAPPGGETAPAAAEPDGSAERPADADARQLQRLLDEVRREIDESLEARQREALAPVIDRLVNDALRQSRESLVKILHDIVEQALGDASRRIPR